MADKIQRTIDRERQEAQAVDVVRRFMIEVNGSNDAGLDWLDSYLKTRKRECKPRYFEKLSGVIADLRTYLESCNIERLGDVGVHHLKALRESYLDREAPLSSVSVNDRMSMLSSTFEDAYREEVIARNPCKSIKPLKEQASERLPFEDDEIKALSAAVDPDSEWAGLMLFAQWTGQRMQDCALAQWEHIDLERNSWHMKTGKTGKVLRLPLVDGLSKWLWRAAERNGGSLKGSVFPEIAGKRSATLSNQFVKIMERAGVDRMIIETGTARKFSQKSFHSFRHTLTTRLKRAGVSEGVAMAVVGHSSKQVSQQYTHLEGEVFEALQGISGFQSSPREHSIQ